MSKKYQDFGNLDLRQKRRRLSLLRQTRNDSDDSNSSNSSFDERLENEVNSDSSSDERPHHCVNEIPTSSDSEDVSMRSGEEVLSHDGENESSNDGDADMEMDDNIFVEDTDEKNDETHENENLDADVPEDPVSLMKRALKNVFLTADVKHKQGNMLVKTLREYPLNLTHIPKDTRTLLNTPTVVASRQVQEIAGGEYLHIGFKRTLINKLESIPANMLPETIEIDFSTDGGRADKGAYQFWAHQFRVFNIKDKRPMIIGIFQGRHKPTNPFDFYERFIREIVDIRIQGGINIRGQLLLFNVRCFIADAPARAFVLNHKGHAASNACSKCKIEGHRCTVPGFETTMVFPDIGHEPRTDEEYANIIDEDHHHGRSPLSAIMGLVSQVPFECMHSVWLGNVKKNLHAQVEGKYGRQRLSGRQLNIINSRLTLLTSYCPSEFNRRPREITDFHSYKATEFRQVLLYMSAVVFKSVFANEYYDHFMILNAAMRLLISEGIPREMLPFCEANLENYVRSCELLYGQQFLSYNVHSLLHLVADVEQLGSLETFSAFDYENNMRAFPKKIRKPHLKLQQYFKRTFEMNDVALAPIIDNNQIQLSKTHAQGPLPENLLANNCQQFHKVVVGKVTFATNLRDSCCILQNSRVYLIRNIVNAERTTFLIVQEFQRVDAVYGFGLTSDVVGIYHCSNLSDVVQAVNFNQVKNKIYRMPVWSNIEGEEERTVDNKWICITLLKMSDKNHLQSRWGPGKNPFGF